MNWGDLLTLLIAYALAMPIGYEREKDERMTGLRTFPILSVSSCAFLLIGIHSVPPDVQSRVFQGLLSGIGVLCAGAVVRDQGGVKGISTAASLLGTAAIGSAVAYHEYAIAVFLTIVIYGTMKFLQPWKEKLDRESQS